MACATTEGLSASGWIDLAKSNEKKRNPHLMLAFIEAVGEENWKKSRSLGHWAAAIADKPYDDGKMMLRRRFYPGDRSYRFGVAHVERDQWIAKAAAKAKADAELADTTKKVAVLLRSGKTPEQVAAALAPAQKAESKPTVEPSGRPVVQAPGNFESIADRSRREALEVTMHPQQLAPRPIVPLAPSEPAKPQEDRTGWPPSWQKNGKPDYATPITEAPYKPGAGQQTTGMRDAFREAHVAEHGHPERGIAPVKKHKPWGVFD
jgi:hypothetical protein